jgi:hypothetical protein
MIALAPQIRVFLYRLPTGCCGTRNVERRERNDRSRSSPPTKLDRCSLAAT